MQSQEEAVAQWQAQLASAQGQLSNFQTGRMRWKVNGVDRTDSHIAALKHTIEGIEKLLAAYGAGPE
jgi:hypothetical protein